MVMSASPVVESSGRNNLLAALRPADFALLSPRLELVPLVRGEALFEPHDPVTTIHFPCEGAIVSLLVMMRRGHVVEAATIGCEGAVGGVISQGSLPAFTRAVVQNGGQAFRMPLAILQEAKHQSPSLRNLFSSYADCLLSQVLQSVACNALHAIEQRCARWLLAARDRAGSDSLELTQEGLAQMLGVQRTYVSKVLGQFQRQGVIRILRGRIELLKISDLAEISCECYGQVRNHFERVLSGVYPAGDPV